MRSRADRGAAAVEWAIGAPILVLLLAAVGYGFAFAQASYAARAAAQTAVNTARVIGGDPGTAQANAWQQMDDLGGAATGVHVTVTKNPQTTTATVTAIIPTLLGDLPVAYTATGPTEHWTTQP
ncbi:TadE/TadG family type IV pilus assembly protein [Catellatospora methionotrophica]|uniref:TadE/TadG family type IV pilus assembly protein n=1 Tax=Catellatospora methionotrophica TaxID=121620 RepID=UPI0033D23363